MVSEPMVHYAQTFYPSSNFVHVDVGRVRRW
jgi:hypothetical protein